MLFAGTRGTGKTDFTKNVIQGSLMPKKLVVDTFDSIVWQNMQTHNHPEWSDVKVPIMPTELIPNWNRGLYRLADSDTNTVMNTIHEYANNALLVFEDATRYVGSRLTEPVKNFVLDSKQKNLDVIFIFHSLVSIPPDLVRISDTLTLFKTNEGHPSKTKYPWAEIPKIMDYLKAHKNRYENVTIQLN